MSLQKGTFKSLSIIQKDTQGISKGNFLVRFVVENKEIK